MHVPVVEGVQPGQLEQPWICPHCWQVSDGVPEHAGATWNSCGGDGNPVRSTLQQICPVQSVSALHAFAHELAHTPLQHSCPVVAQSADVVHAFGHGSFCGFRHNPAAFRFGSIVFADVQQISPDVVLQSVDVEHALGQRLAGVQIA